MMDVDPRTDVPTAELLRQAMEEARMLVKAEIALAKDEMKNEARGLAIAIVSFGSALLLGVLGIAFLLIAFAIGTFPRVLPALIIGIVLVAIAGTAGAIGALSLPKKPLAQTTRRVEGDVEVLKETMA